jgi:hypothetical protein
MKCSCCSGYIVSVSMMSAHSSPVAVAEQARGDRVTIGLVVDQDSAEIVAGRWAKGAEQVSKVGVLVEWVTHTDQKQSPIAGQRSTPSGETM